MTGISRAINTIEDGAWLAHIDDYITDKANDEMHEALDEAVVALREKQGRSRGCCWCKQFAGVPLRGFTTHGCQSMTVKFCPNCGKQL